MKVFLSSLILHDSIILQTVPGAGQDYENYVLWL